MVKHRRGGFTIVELMLAVSFLSVLLLAIATLAIQAGSVYQRGMTLRMLNQSGRELSDSLRRDFLQAKTDRIVPRVVDIRHGGSIIGGRICLGSYSYVWNTAQAIDAGAVELTTFSGGAPVNMARVYDPGANFCELAADGSYEKTISPNQATQLLRSRQNPDDVTIALYDMSLQKVLQATHTTAAEGLYRIRFTLGTGRAGETELIETARTCKPPSNIDSNIEACAVNQFEMIVRTNG